MSLDTDDARLLAKGISYLKDISGSLARIESIAANNNKSTNTTRIGVLRRVSDTIKYIKTVEKFYSEIGGPVSTNVLLNTVKDIKDKLLDIKK